MLRRAVYAGSFDPITNGHLWMIDRGIELFDELVVAIGLNPDKNYSFSLADRLALLRDSLQNRPRLSIATFESQYLVNYARSIDAQFILRGIRSSADFDYERGMRHINADLQPQIATVFLMPPRDISELSSSLVKGLIGPQGWREVVSAYVPPPVYALILEKYSNV